MLWASVTSAVCAKIMWSPWLSDLSRFSACLYLEICVILLYICGQVHTRTLCIFCVRKGKIEEQSQHNSIDLHIDPLRGPWVTLQPEVQSETKAISTYATCHFSFLPFFLRIALIWMHAFPNPRKSGGGSSRGFLEGGGGGLPPPPPRPPHNQQANRQV